MISPTQCNIFCTINCKKFPSVKNYNEAAVEAQLEELSLAKPIILLIVIYKEENEGANRPVMALLNKRI